MSSLKGVMRQVEEKYAINEIDLIVWSNKIDLLALSNLKGEVSLHRLNWQRVWTLPPPIEDFRVSALSWRPDGRVLVISYSREVHVVDIEKKIIVHKIITEEDVCFMQWSQESVDNPDRYKGYLKWMSDAESSCKLNGVTTSKESADVSMENFRKIKIYSHLNFLLIALNNGEIQVHVFGLFCCGRIYVKRYLPNDSQCHIVCADITQNLESLVIVVKTNSNNEYKLRCIIVDTIELANKAQNLYTISYVRGSMLNTVNNINRSMVNIIEAHEHIVIQEMQMQIFEYSKDKEEGTLSAEFMELLLFGFYSSELASFLFSELSDKKMKKIDCSIEVSHANILKQIVHHLRPSIEKLLFELTIILGLSRLSKVFPEKKINIEESLINKCIVAAGAFNLKANKVLHILEDSSIKYKSFIKWLTSVTTVINNERESALDMNQREMNLICDYLCEIDSTIPILEKDELGQYLSDKDVAVINYSETKNLWRKFLLENPCLEKYELMIPCSFESKSLVQVHKYTTELVESIFDNFVNYVKSDTNLSNTTDLLTSTVDCVKKISMIEVSRSDSILVAYIKCQVDGDLLEVVELSKNVPLNPKIATLYFKSAEEDEYKVIDTQFYTNEIISVLLDKEDCLHSFCVQLPVDSIKQFFSTNTHQNVFSVLDKDNLKTIENMKSLKFAVSGPRRVSVIVAEDSHRVRIFEMEAEDEDENATNCMNISNEETSSVSRIQGSEFAEDDFISSTYEGDISTNLADDSDDKLHLENSIIEFGDIDVNTLTMLSDFTDIDDLIARDNVSSFDAELERDIASLAIHSDNSQSTSSVFNDQMSDNEMTGTNCSGSINVDAATKTTGHYTASSLHINT